MNEKGHVKSYVIRITINLISEEERTNREKQVEIKDKSRLRQERRIEIFYLAIPSATSAF